MATRLAWLLNLDADRELSDSTRYQPVSAAQIDAARATMLDLVGPDDLVITAQTTREALARFDAHAVLAFCPTPRAVARLAHLGVRCDAPPLATLRRVNSRRFCAELGQTLPGAQLVTGMDALQACLASASPSGRHVIKREHSFAGREQRRVEHGVLDESTRGFVARSFARAQAVQVEPWMERTSDCSIHGYVHRDGNFVVGEPRGQVIDAMGRFQSMQHEATLSAAHRQALHTEAERTARALVDAGYHGPFGLDAFTYRRDGAEAFNPRCEINARFTMGYPRALLLTALRRDGL